ncbi:MAG: tetratricopeptide repeat protein [Thermoplasmata archaeon]
MRSFDKVLQLDPNFRLGYLKKGSILSKTGKREEAVKVYDAALERFPTDIPILTSKKNTLKSLGWVEDVYYVCDTITNYDYENIEAWKDKAIAARALNRFDDSLSALERAMEMRPKDLDIISEKRKTLIKMGRYREVLDVCNAALKIDPNNVGALRDKGSALQNLKDYSEAIKAFDSALEIDKNDKKTWNSRGVALMQMENYKGALESFDTVLNLDPGNVFALNKKGETYITLKKYDRAIRYFDDALQMNPRNVHILNNKAKALSKVKRSQEALDVLNSVLETHPNDTKTIETKALILFDMDRHEEALSNLESALSVDYSNPYLWKVRAEILDKLNRLDESMEAYQRALDYNPNDSDLWRASGLLYSRLRDPHQAELAYSRALQLAPEDKSLWMMRAFVLEQLNDLEEAKACYDEAIGINGKDKIPWNSKGLVLMKMGKYEKALRCFDRALEMDPNFVPAKNGKKMAEEEIRKSQVDYYARQVLEFEYEYNRAITREEAFRSLKISSQILDAIFTTLGGRDPIELSQLSPQELENYERRSNEVLRRALGTGGEYGLRLCDITYNFPEYSIDEAKRTLSYVDMVNSLAIKPEPSQKLDEYVRTALDMPVEDRTIMGLIRNLDVGIYRARRVLVNLSLFQKEGYERQKVGIEPIMGKDYHPEVRAPPAEPKRREPKPEPKPKVKGEFEGKKCRTHDAQAVTQHRCGQYLCNACIKGEVNCPVCGLPLEEGRGAPRPLPEQKEREEDPKRDFSRL